MNGIKTENPNKILKKANDNTIEVTAAAGWYAIFVSIESSFLMQPIAIAKCRPDGQKPKLKLITTNPIGFIRLLFRFLVVLRYVNRLQIDEITKNKNEKKKKNLGAGSSWNPNSSNERKNVWNEIGKWR